MKPPCYCCNDREAGCHSACSRYSDFRRTMDEAMERRALERKASEFVFIQREGALNRIKRYKHCD